MNKRNKSDSAIKNTLLSGLRKSVFPLIGERTVLRLMGFNYDELSPLLGGGKPAGYDSYILTSDEEIQDAKVLLTARYVAEGIHTAADTEKDALGRNVLRKEIDTSHEHSIYFGVKKEGQLVMVARFIMPHPSKGFSSFHIKVDELYTEFQEKLRAAGPSGYMEFSSYVRAGDRNTFNKTQKFIMRSLLLKEMIQFSWLDDRASDKIWLFGLRAELVPTYKKLFGENLRQIGDKSTIEGVNADFVPFAVDLTDAFAAFVAQARKDPDSRIMLRILLIDLALDQLTKIAHRAGISADDIMSAL